MTVATRPIPVREAQKRLTRSLLLDAAATLFSTNGYASTTVEQIAGAAGATRATVYLHFASKSDIALALREAVGDYDTDRVLLHDVATQPCERTITRWLDGYLEHVAPRTQYASALQSARAEDPVVGRALDAQFAAGTDRFARDLATGRGWDEERARLVATLLLRQLDITTDRWVRGYWPAHREPLRHTLTVMWTAVLTD
jgi:AcrR family transcriptional regulator